MTRCASCRPGDPCEKCFSQAVYDLARLQGWKAYRTPTWRKTGATAGFPDLVLVRGDELLFVELKRDKGQLTAEQEDWGIALSKARDVATFCWKPEQWPLIEEALKP
jgi:hypothetical protein